MKLDINAVSKRHGVIVHDHAIDLLLEVGFGLVFGGRREFELDAG
jgi:hypothetical protein